MAHEDGPELVDLPTWSAQHSGPVAYEGPGLRAR